MLSSWELCISVQNGTFRFAVCRVNNKNNTIEISKAFEVNVPEEFDISKDPEGSAVTGLIRNALKDNQINLKNYKLCISDRDIITRVIKLPKMELKDLKGFMKNSIKQYFPIKKDDYSYDYTIQGVNEEDEKAYYTLFLVAIPTNLFEYYANILLRCGLRPSLIDIYSDVVFNLFTKITKKDIAIMDIGYNYTEFIMIENNSLFINSVINYNLQKSKVSFNEAEYLKNLKEEDLGEDFEIACETLDNYINFFSSRHHGKVIEEIYFIGEGSMLSCTSDIEKDLNIPVINGSNIFDQKVVTHDMPSTMKQNLYLERYCSCFGLIAGGLV